MIRKETDTGSSFSKYHTRIPRTASNSVRSRDGDLSGADSPAQTPPFYSFSLDSSEASIMHLPRKLDLGVGDAGIIGRRVSVMTGSTKGPLTVAEGIIGWN